MGEGTFNTIRGRDRNREMTSRRALSDRGEMIRTKRTYDPPGPADGKRFLVERLWPRGMRKDHLAMDAWLKEVAPSAKLRQWFGHKPERWDEFRRRYEKELDANPDAWSPILDASREHAVTLLYSARDTERNGAVVLRDYVSARKRSRKLPIPGKAVCARHGR
jgi:uncharacterized protein YeaO (DUF488 family)